MSSHALKCLLLEQVSQHPRPEDWEGQEVLRRTAGVLKAMQASHSFLRSKQWPVCVDFMTGNNIKSSWHQDLFTRPSILPSLSALEKFMHSTYQTEPTAASPENGDEIQTSLPTNIDTITNEDTSPIRHCSSTQSNTTAILLRTPAGHLHAAILCKEAIIPFDDMPVYAYVIQSRDNMPSENPLLGWCRRHVYDLYRSNGGVDLTGFSGNDLHQLWILLYLNTIKPTDFTGSAYTRKLEALRRYQDMYKDKEFGGTLWERYIYGSAYDFSHDDLSFLSRASIEDVEKVLECGMHFSVGGRRVPESINREAEERILQGISTDREAFISYWWQLQPEHARYMIFVYLALVELLSRVK